MKRDRADQGGYPHRNRRVRAWPPASEKGRNVFRRGNIGDRLARAAASDSPLPLEDGSRVAVVGGGPAGSLFAYFLLRWADVMELPLQVDVFEPRSFSDCGPAGCNHCGGIVSESLVQLLATDGINLPTEVVQRGIDSYVLHMDVGSVRILTPLEQSRIAAVYRGNGPRLGGPSGHTGFDQFLQEMAAAQGARIARELVARVDRDADGRMRVETVGGRSGIYELAVIASGVNSRLGADLMAKAGRPDDAAATVKTFICEFRLGRDTVEQRLGTSMHVFLLDLPRLQFAALIPKGDFVTCCLLGDDIDDELVASFLASREVRERFPEGMPPPNCCHCFPRINIRGTRRPYGDRIVWIGDTGVARLYKDGIGAAYRTAKAAASTAAFNGVAASDFERHYMPTCRSISGDNRIGKAIFAGSHLAQRLRFCRKAMHRMTWEEQSFPDNPRRLSGILWDLFSGSAPYTDILRRACHPAFLSGFLWHATFGNLRPPAGLENS